MCYIFMHRVTEIQNIDFFVVIRLNLRPGIVSAMVLSARTLILLVPLSGWIIAVVLVSCVHTKTH